MHKITIKRRALKPIVINHLLNNYKFFPNSDGTLNIKGLCETDLDNLFYMYYNQSYYIFKNKMNIVFFTALCTNYKKNDNYYKNIDRFIYRISEYKL